MLSILSDLFERDLTKLMEEINNYKNENDIWKTVNGVSNSSGNLALHLIGNLNHFIGATLGNTEYIRDRDKEFSSKNISKKQLIEDITNTIAVVKATLKNVSDDDLEKDFPLNINNKISSTKFVLLHLLAHLNYHLGQVNYLRRFIQE